MKTFIPVYICLSALLSCNVFALDAQSTFTELDKDANGTLSEAEASEDLVLHESFEQIDKDQSGQISFAEFKQFFQ